MKRRKDGDAAASQPDPKKGKPGPSQATCSQTSTSTANECTGRAVSYSSDSEDEYLQESILTKLLILNSCRVRSTVARPVNQMRWECGEFHRLYPQLKQDREMFFGYMQMYPETFQYICNGTQDKLAKKWANCHARPIGTEERVMLTLRYLSTGLSFRRLAHSFRMGVATVSTIVGETVRVLWSTFQPTHMKMPNVADFLKTAEEFGEHWNFPHCIGTIDAKHIRVRRPNGTAAMFVNKKNFFSVVLQGIVDANYKFINIDVADYGKQSGGTTCRVSAVNRLWEVNKLPLPADEPLPGTTQPLPYVFIAREAYPLLQNVVKPYSGQDLSADERHLNRRLSRVQTTAECAFGMIYSKWRILEKQIETSVETAGDVVKAICILHNLVVDKEGVRRNLREVTLFPDLVREVSAGGRPPTGAKHVRDCFKNYLREHPIADAL